MFRVYWSSYVGDIRISGLSDILAAPSYLNNSRLNQDGLKLT